MDKPLCELTHIEALAALAVAESEVARLRAILAGVVLAGDPVVTWLGNQLVDYAAQNNGASIEDGAVLLTAGPATVTAGRLRNLLLALGRASAALK